MKMSKEYYKEYYNKNKERYKEYTKKYRASHIAICKERVHNWYIKNRAKKLGYNKDWQIQSRLDLVATLGNKCAHCGFSDWRALQVDHINGGGHQERRKMGNCNAYYKNILSLPIDEMKAKYQLLCANCNWIKRYERNELATVVIE